MDAQSSRLRIKSGIPRLQALLATTLTIRLPPDILMRYRLLHQPLEADDKRLKVLGAQRHSPRRAANAGISTARRLLGS